MIASQICNLSRIPMKMESNPIYNTALQLLANPTISHLDSAIYNFNLDFSCLGDVFGVHDLNNHKYTEVFLPWIHNRPVDSLKDEAFVKFDKKKKFKKIKTLLESILKFGYVPDKFPDRKKGIRGYWLEYEGKIKTYIISGNHRSAVLSALNIEIPFMCEDGNLLKDRETLGVGIDIMNYPSIFSAKSVDNWPAVKSGCIDRKTALNIISKYFEE
jgi:hypothetical protein